MKCGTYKIIAIDRELVVYALIDFQRVYVRFIVDHHFVRRFAKIAARGVA